MSFCCGVFQERIFEIFDHSWGLCAWMVKKEAAESLIRNLFPRLGHAQIPGAGIMTDHEKWHIFKSRFVWKFCTQLKRPINQWGPSFIGQTLLGSMMQWLFQDQQPSWLRNIKIFDHKAQQGDTHSATVFFFLPGVVSSFRRKLMGLLKLLLTL